ncbi:MAG: metal-dependent hydrolase [Gammaproteobacteria bacterium]|nr:metal-dependent hydrolase [Gammaproteobacteria bacterium]
MTTSPSRSPDGHRFLPRHPAFELEDALASDWHGGSAFRTAWFNAMSMLFPLGEKFFIDSVRHYRQSVEDPQLQREITAFQGQEAVHRKEHQRYNELLCELRGYDLEAIENPIRERIAWANRELSPRRRLAGTVANEHLTAILADFMLRHRDSLQDADAQVASLWLWHGIEETEHKAVAFDVFQAVGGTTSERREALFYSTWYFVKDTFRIARLMLRKDGKLWSIREWLSGINYLFVRPGVYRRILPAFLRFLRRDFHPWQHDNRDLIAAWTDEQATSPVRPA